VGLYDRYLAMRIRFAAESLPETVALVITERDLLADSAYRTLERFFSWAFEFGATSVVVYVSVADETVVPTIRREFEAIDTAEPLAVRTPDDEARATTPIQVSIGLGGRHEFATAVRRIAESVTEGRIEPDEITESDIEDELVFPTDPDLILKTGAERLSDFMIWQSVYSELYFTDVNWQNFSRREYLRALRDFQKRQRRFGE